MQFKQLVTNSIFHTYLINLFISLTDQRPYEQYRHEEQNEPPAARHELDDGQKLKLHAVPPATTATLPPAHTLIKPLVSPATRSARQLGPGNRSGGGRDEPERDGAVAEEPVARQRSAAADVRGWGHEKLQPFHGKIFNITAR